MSTWVECEDGTWVNLDRVDAIGVTDVGTFVVELERDGVSTVHSRHGSEDSAEATIGRFLAGSGHRCLRRGI